MRIRNGQTISRVRLSESFLLERFMDEDIVHHRYLAIDVSDKSYKRHSGIRRHRPTKQDIRGISRKWVRPAEVANVTSRCALTLPMALRQGGSSFIHETCPTVSQLQGRGPHVQKRSEGLLPLGSRVPHGTGLCVDKRNIRP